MTDSKISGSITLSDGSNSTNIPDVPRPILEALYQVVTSASDTLSQTRRIASILKIDDIGQLVDQLGQWSNPFEPISRHVRITVQSYTPEDENTGSKKSEYHSLKEFQRELPGKTDRVASLILRFEFLARNEAENIINQCELTLEVKGAVRRSFYSIDADNPIGGSLYQRSDNWTAKISIKYSDVIVARGLLGVVDDWYKNLPRRVFPEIGRFRRFLHTSEHYEPYDLVANTYRYSPPVFGSIIASFLGGLAIPYFSETEPVIYWVICFSICTFGFYVFLGSLLKKFESLERGYSVPLIEMTVGDQRRRELFEKRLAVDEKSMNFWGRTVAVGFGVSVLASLTIIYMAG